MRGNGAANTYQANQVSTISKTRLIILMYDGAIRFVKEAINKTNSKDIAGRGICIIKAQKIINELENSLDSNKGGDVAFHLQRAYRDIGKNLTSANVSGEVGPLRLALDSLTTLRDAWNMIIDGDSERLAENQNATGMASQVALNA